MLSSPPSAAVTLRPPRNYELRACRILLPQVDPATQDLQYLIALDDQSRVVAAGALGCKLRDGREHRWHVTAHVVPPLRRRGIARRILHRLSTAAHHHGIPALHSWDFLDPTSEAAAFAAALGFLPTDTKKEFQGPIPALLEATTPLVTALQAKGRIPADIQIIHLRDADPLEVATLHARYLGGTVPDLLPTLRPAHRDAPGAFDTDLSLILLLHGQIIACVLGRTYPDQHLYSCDAVIVDPTHRRGFASLLLRHETAVQALAAGYQTLRFHALSHHQDTQHVATRLGAHLTSATADYRLTLPYLDTPPPATCSKLPEPG